MKKQAKAASGGLFTGMASAVGQHLFLLPHYPHSEWIHVAPAALISVGVGILIWCFAKSDAKSPMPKYYRTPGN